MIIPSKDSGYWIGCANPECSMSEEEPTFNVQVLGHKVYLYCAKCGRPRTIEAIPKLYVSGTVEQ